ncbi:MAG: sugar ABC transporter substrate-binding protein [Candidatus Levyibacteriota bacterium]
MSIDENTVFQGKKDISSLSKDIAPQPVQKETAPILPFESPPDYESSSFFGKILKILIGAIFLFIIGFLIFNFVAPKFLQNKNQKVTLLYWGLWEDKQVIDPLIADFEKQNPNIKIDYTKQDIKQYRERLTTRIGNGDGPDIFRFHNSWLPMFAEILVPLSSDTIKKEDFQKWFYPVIQKDLVKNGAIYGIPLGIDTLALFVNTDSFKAAGVDIPKTWDDFSRVSRSLTVVDENGKIKNSGAAMGTFDNITHAPDIISLLLIQNGTDLENFSKTSQNAIDALTFYTSFAKDEGKVWDNNLDSSILAFAKGNLSMYFGYSWDVFTIKALNPDLKFAIYPVPHLPDRNTTIASYWAEGVSAKSKHQKEALVFIKYLSQKETAQKLFSEVAKTRFFGEPYARVDLADSLKDNPLVFPFVSQANDASSSFFASDTFDDGLNAQMNAYIGNAVRSMLANTSAQSAVDTLTKGVDQILGQYKLQ